MDKYVYITDNNLENRQKYQFAKFEGQSFFDAWLASRQAVYTDAQGEGKKLHLFAAADSQTGSSDAGEAEKSVNAAAGETCQSTNAAAGETCQSTNAAAGETCQSTNAAAGETCQSTNVRPACEIICEEYADRILKSFEVKKRIYSGYLENLVPADPQDYKNTAPYLDFAELMLRMYEKTENLKYLNALLKADDTLLSLKNQLTDVQKSRLSDVLSKEVQCVRQLSGKNGRKKGLYKDWRIEEPRLNCAGSRRLHDTAMLCADSARTKAYLQVLGSAGIYVNHCYIMSEQENDMEDQLREYTKLHGNPQEAGAAQPGKTVQAADAAARGMQSQNLEKYFCLDEPVLYTLRRYGIPYTFIPTGSINSEEALGVLLAAPETYMVYSGFGGQILKPKLFQMGKQYIHAHAGIVPDFRGSTTVYYHMLETGNAAVSVMFLNEKLDEGDILGQYAYAVTDTDVNIDLVFEPYIRAEALRTVLSGYSEDGTFHRRKQEGEGNTYFIIHPVLKHMAVMNLKKNADKIIS